MSSGAAVSHHVALPPPDQKKVYSGAAVLPPPESIVPLIAAANDANATPQMFVAYVAPATPAKSVGYPPHLFCCVASIRKRPIAEAWRSLPQKIAASKIFLLRHLIGAELRHRGKRSSEA